MGFTILLVTEYSIQQSYVKTEFIETFFYRIILPTSYTWRLLQGRNSYKLV